jgi:hypothetical protein
VAQSVATELGGERGVLLLWKVLDKAVASLEDSPPIQLDPSSAVFASRARVTYSEDETYYTLCYSFISRDPRRRDEVTLQAWDLFPRWETDGGVGISPAEEPVGQTQISLETAGVVLSEYLTSVRDSIVRGEPPLAYPIDEYGGAAFDSSGWADEEDRDYFCFCYVLATGLEECWDKACEAADALPNEEQGD